ncbi:MULTISPECIES: acVLRF1 family peptidyl-tRNA hydrolase [Arthrobacter]|uniref:acVLRF1 family peptidyl-tRNA hydrolase n=1 Tax=Arthrobacter TaxID=1663 RepID=UPI0028F73FE4|nr:acVLRF1 family peptidyl-tRNA hydrolase [Arthrobacter sp. lap29]
MNPAQRTTYVPASRLMGWLERFSGAHGGQDSLQDTDDGVMLRMRDGATATLAAPWPAEGRPGRGTNILERLVSVTAQERSYGILLLRRGGFAVGVAKAGKLVAHKVGSASGRSRGTDPAAAVIERASQEASRLFAGAAFEYLGTGGDRQLVDSVLSVPALRRYADTTRLAPIPVQELKMDALMRAAADFASVRIHITDVHK